MLTDTIRHELERLSELANWLDAKFTLPGTRITLGLDSLLGLLPGAGDTVGSLFSLYFVYRAHEWGVPTAIKAKMLWNILLDFVIGTIPLIGDIFDVGFKANIRNIDLLKKHFGVMPQPVYSQVDPVI
jgi:hypothetical protein